MEITVSVSELKKELQNLQQGEFKLGYVYADDIVHLTDVLKVIDRLTEKNCEIYDERGEAQNENKLNLL